MKYAILTGSAVAIAMYVGGTLGAVAQAIDALLLSIAAAALYYALVVNHAARWYAKWLMRDPRATVISSPTIDGWRHTIISRYGVGTIHQTGRRLTASEGTYRHGRRRPQRWW